MTDESKAETGQASTFAPFGRLPKELRDRIWDLAIRKKGPGFHIFKLICKPEYSTPISECENCKPRAGGGWCPCWGECHLSQGIVVDSRNLLQLYHYGTTTPSLTTEAIFNVFKGQPCGFIGSNASAFTIDSALWTACTESKEAMERFLSQQDQHRLDGESDGMTGAHTNNGQDWQRFTVLGHDLLWIQSCPCYRAHFSSYLHRGTVPLFGQILGPKNVALEFKEGWDPEWPYIDIENNAQHDMFENALRYADDLWIIDHRLRRRRSSALAAGSVLEDDRKVFWGNGCRLVEVRISDSEEWELTDGMPFSPLHPWDQKTNPFALMHAWYLTLCSAHYDHINPKPWNDIEEWWEDEMQTNHDKFGRAIMHVLAFEVCE